MRIETATQPSEGMLENLQAVLPDLEKVYVDLHVHPELSMQEARTAELAAGHLRTARYEVTTGIVVVIAPMLHVPAIVAAIAGGLLCFALRFGAIPYGWHLPTARPRRVQAAAPSSPNDSHPS